jgi:xanthine dehydrogenase accessory factor
MSFDVQQLVTHTDKHGPVARILVTQTKGSAPRNAGTSMLVWAHGQDGTIGGGTLEYQAITAARAVLKSGETTHTNHVPLGPALGQCCGGAVTLVTEVFTPQTLPTDTDIFARPLTDQPQSLAVKRALAAHRNHAAPITAPRRIDGWLIEPIHTARTPLWIWGAGHVGRAVVGVLAPLPDWDITWIDTAPDRFPADAPVTTLPAAMPATLVPHAPGTAYHLIFTYSHATDLELCHQLLTHNFAHTGLIGSATKWARFRSRLGQLGHTPAQIDRITCPIGDPGLGKHPQAIAIGVAQQITSLRGQTSRTQKAMQG